MAIAQDMRKYQAMTKADALALFFKMARLLNRIRKISLEADRKAILAKELGTAATAPFQKEYDALHAELTEYLKAHQERFIKPRKVNIKGVGSFGWENDPAKVGDIKEDTRKQLLKQYSDKNELNLYTLEIVPDKKAILAALLDGHQIPGVEDYVPAGANPKISFSKSIDEENIPGE